MTNLTTHTTSKRNIQRKITEPYTQKTSTKKEINVQRQHTLYQATNTVYGAEWLV